MPLIALGPKILQFEEIAEKVLRGPGVADDDRVGLGDPQQVLRNSSATLANNTALLTPPTR